MRKVEMHKAYRWMCEDCGRDNFLLGVQITGQQREELAAEVGCPVEDVPEDLIGFPKKVTCPFCESQFLCDIDEAFPDDEMESWGFTSE